MPFANYSELDTAIQNWLNSSTPTSGDIDDFIRLGEARITQDFAMSQLLGKLVVSETITANTTPEALNAGYRGSITAYLDLNPKRVLDYMPADSFFRRYASSETGVPRAYTIVGMDMHLGPTPEQSYNLIHYYVKMPDIATDTTNAILTNHPDLYLAAALIEGFDFLGNTRKMERWEVKYRSALVAIEEEARNIGSPQILLENAS